MPRGVHVRVLGAAFGRGEKLRVGERFTAAARFAGAQISEAIWGSVWSPPGVLMGALLLGAAVVLARSGSRHGDGAACWLVPLSGVVAFVLWLVVGLFRYETKPPTGHVEVRDDALLCRFEDGGLSDLPWSEVARIRVGGDTGQALFIEHGHHQITELRGTPFSIRALHAEIGAALERFLPMETARRLLGRGGKPISDWLASVRARFQSGAYRSAPPPLTRDQLLRVLLCPRLGVDERIGAAAALSALGGQERNTLSRLRVVTRQVESPALRIAADRAMEDALDEAAIAEAAAEAAGHGGAAPHG